MRILRRVLAAALLAALTGVVAMAGCSATGRDRGPAPDRAASGDLLISTGTEGGVYHAWGAALAAQLGTTAPGLRVRVETSVGSVSNLRRVALGVADLGLTTMDATEEPPDGCRLRATEGDDPRDRPPLRALARVYDDYVQVVVRKGSGIETIADLAGRPVAVGSTGSGTALVACRLLRAATLRVQEKPLNVASGITALAAGQVDAVIWSGGLPTRAISATTTPVRLLPLGSLASALRTRYGAVYRTATVPSGFYGADEQVTTLASPNLLVARADADAAMVEAVLGAVFGRRDQIAAAVPAADTTDRRTAVFTGSLPLHPAAVDYYRRSK